MKHSSHNPDILSCIANLSSDEVFTPPNVVNQILDNIPEDFWKNPSHRVLDPASKSGVFLREIAKRFMDGLADQIIDPQERINHILKKQLFGLPLTELTALISRRTLYCSKLVSSPNSLVMSFENSTGNIIDVDTKHQWEKGKCTYCGAMEAAFSRTSDLDQHAYPFLHLEKVFDDMKFDLIIGNPPYHISDSGESRGSSPIYQHFVNKCKKMNPDILCLIIPSRWFAGGKGLDSFRSEMLADKRLKKLVDYPIASDVFPGLAVIGGICYFIWDSNYSGDCEVTTNLMGVENTVLRSLDQFDTFIRFNQALPILEKVEALNYSNLSDQVSRQKPFGLRTYDRPSGRGGVTLYANKAIGLFERAQLPKGHQLVDKYKVIISMAYGEGGEKRDYPRMVLGKPIIAEPPSACTETYLVVGAYNTLIEAENFSKFLKTKFCRFLVSLRKNTQHITSDRFRFVPKLEMNVEWDDEKLFKYFKISKSEIEFIDTLVKPME